MKNSLILTSLLCATFLITGCGSTSAPSTRQPVVTHGSAKAHILSLSAEDIFYLNQQSPAILKKIDRGEKVDLEDVIMMHEAGVSAESIIAIIDFTATHFELNTNDVIRLQMEGVSFKVINHMIQS